MASFPYQHHPVRLEALEAGQDRFMLEYPCRQGHRAPRYVANGQCVQCRGGSIAPRRPKQVKPVFIRSEHIRLRRELAAKQTREKFGLTPPRRRRIRGLNHVMDSVDARKRSEYLNSLLKRQ
jgi:hypothetical protein